MGELRLLDNSVGGVDGRDPWDTDETVEEDWDLAPSTPLGTKQRQRYFMKPRSQGKHTKRSPITANTVVNYRLLTIWRPQQRYVCAARSRAWTVCENLGSISIR